MHIGGGEQELERVPTHTPAASLPPGTKLEQKQCQLSPSLCLLVLTANPRGGLASAAGLCSEGTEVTWLPSC